MKLPAGRVPLLSSGFDEVLETVHSFHDGSLGFAHFDYLGPMAFIDSMWFGPELLYNPKPVIGGVFWFDIDDWNEVKHLASQSNRQIYRVVIQREVRSIEFQLQDKPYERLEFKFGPDASFQFIASDSLHDVILERRKSPPYVRPSIPSANGQ